jgi:hypothetical protein
MAAHSLLRGLMLDIEGFFLSKIYRGAQAKLFESVSASVLT